MQMIALTLSLLMGVSKSYLNAKCLKHSKKFIRGEKMSSTQDHLVLKAVNYFGKNLLNWKASYMFSDIQESVLQCN